MVGYEKADSSRGMLLKGSVLPPVWQEHQSGHELRSLLFVVYEDIFLDGEDAGLVKGRA